MSADGPFHETGCPIDSHECDYYDGCSVEECPKYRPDRFGPWDEEGEAGGG